MNQSNLFLWAAVAMLPAFFFCGVACFRCTVTDRLVALEMTGVLTVLELVLLTEAYHRPPFFDLPLTLAFLSLGSGLVFARFIQRWV